MSPAASGQWTENILYNFTGQTDGGDPSGVVLDQAGNLYGGADYGGDLNCNTFLTRYVGCGVVFELSNNGNGSWTETALHVFGLSDGAFPTGSLVFDSSGNLYGATTGGPGDGCEYEGCGTIFRMANDGSWSFTSIYTFAGGTDGASPNGGLAFDQNSNLYGTTAFGGGQSACFNDGCGTAFELLTSSMVSLHPEADGEIPKTVPQPSMQLACAKCSFYLPKHSSQVQLLEGKANLLQLRQEIPLSEGEVAAVDDGVAAMEKLLELLVDVPTPAGPTPRELQIRTQGTAKSTGASPPRPG